VVQSSSVFADANAHGIGTGTAPKKAKGEVVSNYPRNISPAMPMIISLVRTHYLSWESFSAISFLDVMRLTESMTPT